MLAGVTGFTSILQGDSSEFMRKAQTLVVGVARSTSSMWMAPLVAAGSCSFLEEVLAGSISLPTMTGNKAG